MAINGMLTKNGDFIGIKWDLVAMTGGYRVATLCWIEELSTGSNKSLGVNHQPHDSVDIDSCDGGYPLVN